MSSGMTLLEIRLAKENKNLKAELEIAKLTNISLFHAKRYIEDQLADLQRRWENYE